MSDFKHVPVKATDEMMVAASNCGYPLTWSNIVRVWNAMIAAAPTRPSSMVIAYRVLQSETGNPLTDWIDGAPDGEPALSSSKYQLAYEHPSPAESDKEAVRNAAMEEAAKVCDYHFGLPECPQRAQLCAEDIRAMISKPELKPDVEPDFYLWGDEVIWKLSPEMNEYIRQQGTPLFEHPPLKTQPAQPSDTELLRDAITAILWLDRRIPRGYKDVSHVMDVVARLEAVLEDRGQS